MSTSNGTNFYPPVRPFLHSLALENLFPANVATRIDRYNGRDGARGMGFSVSQCRNANSGVH